MKLNSNIDFKEKISNYPQQAQKQLQILRNLIVQTAKKNELVHSLEETLKWGEPSYLTKHGSTIRIDWKAKAPEQIAIYFKCTSNLVPTFKVIYKDVFLYEGNRAIVFGIHQNIPKAELEKCITLALTYHKVKHLPFLGA